jgi:hypothetical protein
MRKLVGGLIQDDSKVLEHTHALGGARDVCHNLHQLPRTCECRENFASVPTHSTVFTGSYVLLNHPILRRQLFYYQNIHRKAVSYLSWGNHHRLQTSQKKVRNSRQIN